MLCKLKFNREKKEDILYLRCYVPGFFGFQISWAKTPSDGGWYGINGKERFFWIGKIRNEKAFLVVIGRMCAGIVFPEERIDRHGQNRV